MKKKPENTSHGNKFKVDSHDPVLTRRMAIKRLAKIVGSSVVGAVVVGQLPGCASMQSDYSSGGQYWSQVKYYSYSAHDPGRYYSYNSFRR
jgi:hypothetical protein